MTELRESFTPGTSTLASFYGWMNERHSIWDKRDQGLLKPWTQDPIMQVYKFTNVFRELDPGTIMLRLMEQKPVIKYLQAVDTECDRQYEMAALILFNTIWWRIWNWHEHGPNLGFVGQYSQLEEYMLGLHHSGKRMWTSAHMVRGEGGEPKVFPYLRLMKAVWDYRANLTLEVVEHGTLQGAFNRLLNLRLVGDFTAYEIASDLRWSLLRKAPDKLTWGNPGNGAIRGMRRLGFPPTIATMRWLWEQAPFHLSDALIEHFPAFISWDQVGFTIHEDEDFATHEDEDVVKEQPTWPPFEIREIEHSLCEFDKHQRAIQGQGAPRQKYPGV